MVKNFYLTAALLCSVITTVICTPSWAYDDDYYNFVVDTFDNQLRPQLQSLLPSSERDIIEDVSIRVLPAPNLPTVAMTRENPPEVVISLGFLDGLFQHIDCLLIETSPHATSEDMCATYFQYFFSEVINPNSPHPKSVARYFLDDDSAKVRSWYQEQQLSTARNQMMFSALIFIFMHEFGHHITGFFSDTASLSEKRKVEAAADDWAARSLAAINERPVLGATLSLGYIARMEQYRIRLADAAKDDPQFVQIDAPHPIPKDRVTWSFERYCGAAILNANPNMKGPCDFIQELIEKF